MQLRTAAFILAALVLFGCTQGGDSATNIVSNLPEVQNFLAENPDSDLTVVLLTEAEITTQLADISEKCGKSIPAQDYFYANIESPESIMQAWVSVADKQLVCFIRKVNRTDSCEEDTDCDDNNPATRDVCSGEPKTCGSTYITACAGGDEYCPEGCTTELDSDCGEVENTDTTETQPTDVETTTPEDNEDGTSDTEEDSEDNETTNLEPACTLDSYPLEVQVNGSPVYSYVILENLEYPVTGTLDCDYGTGNENITVTGREKAFSCRYSDESFIGSRNITVNLINETETFSCSKNITVITQNSCISEVSLQESEQQCRADGKTPIRETDENGCEIVNCPYEDTMQYEECTVTVNPTMLNGAGEITVTVTDVDSPNTEVRVRCEGSQNNQQTVTAVGDTATATCSYSAVNYGTSKNIMIDTDYASCETSVNLNVPPAAPQEYDYKVDNVNVTVNNAAFNTSTQTLAVHQVFSYNISTINLGPGSSSGESFNGYTIHINFGDGSGDKNCQGSTASTLNQVQTLCNFQHSYGPSPGTFQTSVTIDFDNDPNTANDTFTGPTITVQ
ncbi:MAG: hypothetical protein Q7S92_04310 [Candidatus Diapherotrites archaeon]|nr:hypothetical protein [Candidatus Diapherotrites archaeon]